MRWIENSIIDFLIYFFYVNHIYYFDSKYICLLYCMYVDKLIVSLHGDINLVCPRGAEASLSPLCAV